jgi:hypothetical protein
MLPKIIRFQAKHSYRLGIAELTSLIDFTIASKDDIM